MRISAQVNLGPATNAMVASGMFRGCYATEFENDVCVCTRCTGDLLTTKSACVSYERQRQACAKVERCACQYNW